MLRGKCQNEAEYKYFVGLVEAAIYADLDAWDYQWLMTCWMQSGLTIIPKRNLVSNRGFREDATHTTAAYFSHLACDWRAARRSLDLEREEWSML